ncbi:MAG: AAA family ATPase, partial [Candidatus Lokiarchaeota archaeon]|nr:AAA family ATPase [Candidatus Lokiarchaeota archaeon]
MTYIKKISMTGFKSFGNRTVTVNFSSGFTCIVGPNGAGKSNIIDALCFALGRLSKKTMRAKSLEDLIFAGSKGQKPANSAKVTLYFDNSEGIFPGGTEDFQISRIVRRNKGNKYKMNGKTATRTQILNSLATTNIDPDGTNQFVLQGKIVELTHMNPDSRREFIEELIGLQKYDDMKNATLKELEKAERDLGQFEAIFKEVSSQLRKVEKEKNDALAWKELDEKIKFINAQLIALKISKLQKEEDDLERKIDESNGIVEELNEKISRQEDVLSQEALIMENLQKIIEAREKEKEKIIDNLTQLKTKLSSKKTALNHAENTIEKLMGDRTNLEKQLMTLEKEET